MNNSASHVSRVVDSPFWTYLGPVLRDGLRAVVFLLVIWGLFLIVESSPLRPSYTRELELALSQTKLELARVQSPEPLTARRVGK